MLWSTIKVQMMLHRVSTSLAMPALTVTLLPTKLALLVSALQYNGEAAIILALLLAGINDTGEA
jgi:hypothetical protein